MAIFAIVLSEQNDEMDALIGQTFKHIYKFSHQCTYFVAHDGTVDEISEKLKFFENNEQERIVSGIVCKLNSSYSGFEKKALWEWMESNEGSK